VAGRSFMAFSGSEKRRDRTARALLERAANLA
jgi:hypothetical protein